MSFEARRFSSFPILAMTGAALLLSACARQEPAQDMDDVPDLTKATNPATASSSGTPGLAIAPGDTCSDLQDFDAFRAQIQAAVRARDMALLEPILSENIKNSFGGDGGSDEFVDKWTESAETEDELWSQLALVDKLGCAAKDGTAVMPYYFWNLPDDVDAYTAFIPVRASVPLYTEPSLESITKADLNWNVLSMVKSSDTDPDPNWHHVKTSEGLEGYVAADDVRSALDYRALFNQENGAWRMTAFIAGD